MDKSILESLLLPIKERIHSPIWRTFIISWCVWNSPVLYVVVFGSGVTERMSLINQLLYHDWYYKLTYSFVLPTLSTALYIFAFPYLRKYVYTFTRDREAEILAIKHAKDSAALMTLEEATALREEMKELKQRHSHALSSLMDEIRERDQRIKDLERDNSKSIHTSEETDKSKPIDELKSLKDKVLQVLAEGTQELDRLVMRTAAKRLLVQHVIDELLAASMVSQAASGSIFLTAAGRKYVVEHLHRKTSGAD